MLEFSIAIFNFIGLILGFILNYMKLRNDTKKSEARSYKRFDDLDRKIEILKVDSENIKSYHDNENKLFNDLTNKAFSIISLNGDLDTRMIQILNYTRNKIRAFALEHNDSSFRNKKEDLKAHLVTEGESITQNIKHLANKLFTEKKDVKVDGKSVKMDYDKFVYHETDMTPIIRTLVRTLKNNGLTEVEYNSTFVDFLNDIMLEQIKAYRSWLKL